MPDNKSKVYLDQSFRGVGFHPLRRTAGPVTDVNPIKDNAPKPLSLFTEGSVQLLNRGLRFTSAVHDSLSDPPRRAPRELSTPRHFWVPMVCMGWKKKVRLMGTTTVMMTVNINNFLINSLSLLWLRLGLGLRLGLEDWEIGRLGIRGMEAGTDAQLHQYPPVALHWKEGMCRSRLPTQGNWAPMKEYQTSHIK